VCVCVCVCVCVGAKMRISTRWHHVTMYIHFRIHARIRAYMHTRVHVHMHRWMHYTNKHAYYTYTRACMHTDGSTMPKSPKPEKKKIEMSQQVCYLLCVALSVPVACHASECVKEARARDRRARESERASECACAPEKYIVAALQHEGTFAAHRCMWRSLLRWMSARRVFACALRVSAFIVHMSLCIFVRAFPDVCMFGVFVCVSVCVCACVCVHACARMHVCVRVVGYLCTFVHACVRSCVVICVRVRLYVCLCRSKYDGWHAKIRRLPYIWYVCCSALQCVAMCCSVCRNVLQCVAAGHSVLQCISAYCGVLYCVAVFKSVLQGVAVCCSVLQCVAVFCNWSHCIAVYRSVL